MGRQLNKIIEGLAGVTSGTSTINVNLDAIEALLTTLQADVADGLIVTNGTGVLTGGTLTTGTLASATLTAGTLTNGTVTANPIRGATTIGTLTAGTTNGTLFSTNSTRSYLLVQCTSGTAFIDTNGTASTANGIQLTSGQGITFEGSFVPTGAIAGITSTGTAQLIGRQG